MMLVQSFLKSKQTRLTALLMYATIAPYCRHRLMVRTSGFHPGNRGSIPLGDTNKNKLFQTRLACSSGMRTHARHVTPSGTKLTCLTMVRHSLFLFVLTLRPGSRNSRRSTIFYIKMRPEIEIKGLDSCVRLQRPVLIRVVRSKMR